MGEFGIVRSLTRFWVPGCNCIQATHYSRVWKEKEYSCYLTWMQGREGLWDTSSCAAESELLPIFPLLCQSELCVAQPSASMAMAALQLHGRQTHLWDIKKSTLYHAKVCWSSPIFEVFALTLLYGCLMIGKLDQCSVQAQVVGYFSSMDAGI